MAKSDRISGKLTAATRLPDGTIEIAPMWGEEIRKLRDEEVAAQALLTTVLEYMHQIHTRISARRYDLFRRLGEDLGLPLTEERWTLENGKLVPPKAPAATAR